MVIDMTKYSFILLDRELNDFLQKIQEWGVMDIKRTYKAVDDTSREYIERAQHFNNALRNLKNFKAKEETKLDNIDKPTVSLEFVEEQLELSHTLATQKLELQKEYTTAQVWGDFDSNDLKRIEALNLEIHFYVIPEKKFEKSWETDYTLQILNTIDGKVYFVVIAEKGTDYAFPIPETKFPERSISEIEQAIKQNADAISRNEAILISLQSQIEELKQQKSEHDAQLDLYLANVSTEKAGEGEIAVIEGFAPTTEDAVLAQKLDEYGVFYMAEAATPEDNPPVKLKNNWFASLFEPIGNLYMLPKYGELDLTPFFAPFYMLFFGLCLGDMGYGLLLLLVGIFGTLKLPKLKKYAQLVMFLGIGSIIMPAMTGTFFGVSLYDHIQMPQWLYDVWYNPDNINIKMFWFALIFGVFQICVGRLISAVWAFKKKGWQYGLANIGWAVFTVWAAIFFAEWQGGFTFLSPIANYIMLGISGVCIIFFSTISKNIFKRIAGGVKAVYDITGLLGDVLSYVRLFGLGAAGGILGLVMNQIALSLGSLPYVGWLLFILMAVIGHSLVIFLSCLGAFVHPIRLTFVEFYKNADFQGGGREFKPMRK